jgi:hypothetical protein
MQTEEHQSGPPEIAADTGHTFAVESYRACLDCHQPLVDPERGEALMKGSVELVQTVIGFEIEYTKKLLDDWGAGYAPAEIAEYDVPWEYANPGDLSEGTAPPTGANGQDRIPEAIQKARFNLYIVHYDGSIGVHNPWYALDLLWYAQELVWEAMSGAEK